MGRSKFNPLLCAASRALLALTAAATFVLVAAPAASAHDSLVSSSPSDGQTVDTMPDQIVLTFDEAAVAVGTRLVISGPDGQVQQGAPALVKNTVVQAVDPAAPAGRYTVTWRVTSADGHPVSGTFSFTARTAGTPSSSPAVSTAPTATTSASGSVDGSTATTTAGTPSAAAAAPTSSTSAGVSGQSGTSWALWLVGAVLVLAAAGATAVRLRRGRTPGDHG